MREEEILKRNVKFVKLLLDDIRNKEKNLLTHKKIK